MTMQPNQPPVDNSLRGMPPPTPPPEPKTRNTNHLLHLVLSIVTFGLWVFVWPCVALINSYMNGRDHDQHQHNLARYQHVRWEWERANR